MKRINVGETRGMIRGLDSLGRVVIPIEFRKVLGIKKNDPIEIFLVKDGIYLRKG